MTPRRLFACAALLHVVAALALFVAGRVRLAPSLIDRDGVIARAAHDSVEYRDDATALVLALRRGGIAAWARTPGMLHVRVISLCFAALSPLLGFSTLAAEPFNLAGYLAVLALVFAIGREVAGRREGLIAAAIVAVWPSFLFHTLQLLKDSLFIAGALVLTLTVLTWLTRTYRWRDAVVAGALLIAASAGVLIVRPKAMAVVGALILVALVMLLLRQIGERRALLANLSCAIVTLAVIGIGVIGLTRTYEKTKSLPAADSGEPKSAASLLVPTLVDHRPPFQGPFAAADLASLRAGSIRSRFSYTNREAGSGIDDEVSIHNLRELIAYAPRAAVVGLWAPFPRMWMARGRAVGSGGRLLSGLETVAMTVIELFAIAAVLLPPRRLPALLLLAIAILGVSAEALVVSNLGALYRFRFAFWFLFIVLGVTGIEKLRGRWRPALVVALALACAACGRTPQTRPGDLRIANLTGYKIRGLYLAPHDARTWQENVLGADVVRDGDTLVIHMPASAKATAWDLRVDGEHGYRAEWSALDLSKVSAMDLRIENGAVVADLESGR